MMTGTFHQHGLVGGGEFFKAGEQLRRVRRAVFQHSGDVGRDGGVEIDRVDRIGVESAGSR